MLKNNPGKVNIVFKNFPLRRHQYAVTAASAALAAHQQGKFWEFHDRLFNNYNRLNDQKVKAIARDLGLNPAEFEKQMESSQILARVKQDREDGVRIGVQGTPTIFINGKRLRTRTFTGFQTLIDKELKK